MKRKCEKVYISGRMSGLSRAEVLRRFTEADDYVRSLGYRTVNPVRVWMFRCRWLYRLLERLAGHDHAYELVLLYDLWLLSRCDSILMIGKDWVKSRGAFLEYQFARVRRIKIDAEYKHLDDESKFGNYEKNN